MRIIWGIGIHCTLLLALTLSAVIVIPTTVVDAFLSPTSQNPAHHKTRWNEASALYLNDPGGSALPEDAEESPLSRRSLFGLTLFSAGTMLSPAAASADDVWLKTPINPKRTNARVNDAENLGYNLSFVTYLTRFLLSFEPSAQKYWIARASEIPTKASEDEVLEIRKAHFGALAASVEVGLRDFSGKEGVKRLLQQLLDRYVITSSDKRIARESREAQRQLALLFSLLIDTQPTQEITKLLAAVDNDSMSNKVVLLKNSTSRRGYRQGDKPEIEFPVPPAGNEGYIRAQCEATLEPIGNLLELELIESGSGFQEVPNVVIAPPKASTGRPAAAVASVKNGRIVAVKMTDSGDGYTQDDVITVHVATPDGGSPALIRPVLEYGITSIVVTEPGSGYAAEKPVRITLSKSDESEDPLIGYGYPAGIKASFSTYRKDGDNLVKVFEQELDKKYLQGQSSGSDEGLPATPFITASTSQQLVALIPRGFGLEYDIDTKRYFISVEPDFLEKYPAMAMDGSSPTRPLTPDFGPRGRSPIERDQNINLSTFLRFSLSGALCTSGVRLIFTPLDVVKTKVQTKPDVYPTISSAFSKVWRDEGPATFYTGWVPTILGNFLAGGIFYATTEAIRRSLSDIHPGCRGLFK